MQSTLVPRVTTFSKRIRQNLLKMTPDRIQDARLQGIACALGELAGAHMEPDLAKGVLQSLGLTVADLKAAGADPHDLDPLKGLQP